MIGQARAGAVRGVRSPPAMIEPRPRVRRTRRLQAVQIADRALQPDRRWVRSRRQTGTSRRCRRKSRWRSAARRLVEYRHVHGVGLAPEPKQRRAALRQSLANVAPAAAVADTRGHGRLPCEVPRRRSVERSACGLSEQLGDVLEPHDHRWRQVDAATKTSARCSEHRHVARPSDWPSVRGARRRRCRSDAKAGRRTPAGGRRPAAARATGSARTWSSRSGTRS